MKIAILTGCIFLAFSTTAQDPRKDKSDVRTDLDKARYCAMLKDGKMVLMKDNSPVPADITLNNGNRISKDGTVQRKDGSSVTLSNGDCVDDEGNVLSRKVKSEKKEFQNHETDPDTPDKQKER